MEIILGLDVSSSCIGMSICAYDGENIKLLHVSHLRLKTPRKKSSMEALFAKSDMFHEHIKQFVDYKITHVVIEEPLISSNNSITAGKLMRFNGMISQSVREVLGVIPDFISSYDARKFGFPELLSVRKFNKKGDCYDLKQYRRDLKKDKVVLFGSYPFVCEKKHILWNLVSDVYPDINWVYDNKNNLKNENFDASDSLVCVFGFINKRLHENEEPKILEWNESEHEGRTIFRYKVSFCGKIFDKVLEI